MHRNTPMLEMMLENPMNRALLDILAGMDIQDVTLTAGCLFQTVWNVQSGKRPEWGINDYDVFYYDPDTR